MGTEHTSDAEILIRHEGYTARIAPLGASLRGFWCELADGSAHDIVTSYSGAEAKVGAQGDVMIPFPGRIKDAQYEFDGRYHHMEANDKDGPNAIHGFVRGVPWNITYQSLSEARFALDMHDHSHVGYPFSLRAEISYGVSENGLTCGYKVTNMGSGRAPVAVGFHPYFVVGAGSIDDWTLELPMSSVLEFVNLIPTGRVLSVENTPYDFRSPRKIGSTCLDNCFVNPARDKDGRVKVRLSNDGGTALTVWADSSMNYIVLFSGETLPKSHQRQSLAIEPMTCGSDAFNHPDWGLVTLAPGDTTAGAWGVLPV